MRHRGEIETLRNGRAWLFEVTRNRLTDHFQMGAIAFDAISPAATRMAGANRSIRATGATFGGFSVDDPQELQKVAPKLKFVKAVANLSAIALDKARMHETLQASCDLMVAHKYRIDDN